LQMQFQSLLGRIDEIDVESFESRQPNTLFAYLRKVVFNRLILTLDEGSDKYSFVLLYLRHKGLLHRDVAGSINGPLRGDGVPRYRGEDIIALFEFDPQQQHRQTASTLGQVNAHERGLEPQPGMGGGSSSQLIRRW